MPDATISALFNLTPQEAVDYLKGRGQLTQTFSWQDLWQEEHARQFTVSRLANMDLLQSLRDGITKSVAGDLTRRDWTKNAKQLLQDAGWWGKNDVVDQATGETVSTTFDSARLKLIYDTNTRTAYAAGQWKRIQRNKATHPYLLYLTMHDDRVRPAHRAWDYLCLPVDDPFWEKHFPPNGFRCRCRVIPVTQEQYDSGEINGRRLVKDAPKEQLVKWTNRRTGEISEIPAGVDPGFAYNPGIAAERAAQVAELEAQKLAQAEQLAAEYERQAGLLDKTDQYVARSLADKSVKQYPLRLDPLPPEFSAVADQIEGVNTAGKKMYVYHDDVIHIMKQHGHEGELARGQLPVQPQDFIYVMQNLANAESIVKGEPFELKAVKRIDVTVAAAGYRYRVIFAVRKLAIAPVTMWKWVMK